MYEFWYDYMKPKYANNVKLCYTGTYSFIINIKANDFYEDIASDVENRFDTSNYEVNRPWEIIRTNGKDQWERIRRSSV